MKQKRPITDKERSEALKFYWLIIPVAIIASLIVWVLISYDKMPSIARFSGSIIISGVVLIFISKWLKLSRELKKGFVVEIEGSLDRKVKLGYSNGSSPTSGIGKGSRRTPSSTTYILEIGGDRYHVNKRLFNKAEEGDQVQLIYLEKTDFVLDIMLLKKS